METIGPYRLLEVLADRHDGKVWRAADSRGSVATVAVLAEHTDDARATSFRDSADPPGRNQVLASDLSGGTPWVAFLDDGGQRAGALFDRIEEIPAADSAATEPHPETPHHVPPSSPAESQVPPSASTQETPAAPAPFSAPLAQFAPAAPNSTPDAPPVNDAPEGVARSAYGTASPPFPVSDVESDTGQHTVLMRTGAGDSAPLPRPEFTYDTPAVRSPVAQVPPATPVSPVYGAPYSGLPAYGSQDPNAPAQPTAGPQPPAQLPNPAPPPFAPPVAQQFGPPQPGPPYSPPQPYSAPPQPGPPYGGQPPYAAPPQQHSAPPGQHPQFAPPVQQPYSAPPASSAPPWQQHGGQAGGWQQPTHPQHVVPPLPVAAPDYDDEPRGLRSPKAIAILIAVVALLLGGGGATIWVATQGGTPNPKPTAGPSQPAPSSPGVPPSSGPSSGSDAPTKASDVMPPVPAGQPGQEPPSGGAAPTWPTFGADEQVSTMGDLTGLGFDLTLPEGWQCVLAQQSDTGVRHSCGGRGAGVEIGGDVSVRKCSIPCDPKRKIAMRKKENAWGLRWARVDGHTTFVETETLRGTDGKKRYGLVLVRYFHEQEGGPLNKQLVLRMTAPLDRADDLRKIANTLLTAAR